MKKFQVCFILLIITLFFSLSASRDTVTPSQPLPDNDTLISVGGTFALGFFSPVNSNNRYVGMWYNKVAERRIVWVANRKNPVTNSTGLLSVTANGTLMITNENTNEVVWSIRSTGSVTNPTAQLLETGNFVLNENSWQSFNYPTDTLLTGMKLGFHWNSGFSTNLTAWKSDTDPSSGEYYVAVEENTDTYLYHSSGAVVWRSGPWDALNFHNLGLNYSYVNTTQESDFSFDQDSNDIMIQVTNLTGKAQLYTPSKDLKSWDLIWEEPSNICNTFGYCGPNGVCDITASPLCSCLIGHVPKNPGNWAKEDWVDGCVANTGLDCGKETAFVKVSGVKMPESATSMTDTAFTLDQCRYACLRNCSCTAYAMDGGRSGCANWFTDSLWDMALLPNFDQDIYLRVSSSFSVIQSQPRKKKTHTMVIILVSLISVALVTGVACVACFLLKKKTRKRLIFGAKKDEESVNIDIPLYDYATIEEAMDYFSAENELGQGGFGTVYKGKLRDGQIVAVKRLAATSLQGTDEFKNEVILIAKLQNINLVQLLGCCVQEEERLLIYEYMPNNSLDAILFDKEKNALLDWPRRYQIIIGIARGLLYLHHDSLFRVIHRDLKASNILLDYDMNPKISDFGMARLFGGDETDFNTRKIVGTYGYMSPEYAMEGIFSLKSDVFSFGVLMLEIISGKKNRGGNVSSSYFNLVAETWSLWERGESLNLVEESMRKSLSANAILRCIKVGLLCVQENAEDRPLMSTVVIMLGADITSLPEPHQPGFVGIYSAFDSGKFRNNKASDVSSELTITLEGR